MLTSSQKLSFKSVHCKSHFRFSANLLHSSWLPTTFYSLIHWGLWNVSQLRTLKNVSYCEHDRRYRRGQEICALPFLEGIVNLFPGELESERTAPQSVGISEQQGCKVLGASLPLFHSNSLRRQGKVSEVL